MRAAILSGHGGPENLRAGEVPNPTVFDGQVLVRVKRAALNHLDLWVRGGLPGLKLTFPHILCGDGAGVVEKTASSTSRFKAGDEVIIHPGLSCMKCERCLAGWESLCPEYKILGEHVNGTAAEFVSVPEVNLFAKPKNISFDEAAAIPLVFTTAWQMVARRVTLKPGDWVVVHAAGSGVSSAAIQIARLFKARVLATAGSEPKLQHAKKLGAEVALNYKTEDFLPPVKKLTDGRGVAAIFDHTGKDLWEKNIKALAAGGSLVTCGATSGGEAVTPLAHVFYRQLSILGSTMGSKLDFPKILEYVASGQLKATVDKCFKLGQVGDAMRKLENREVIGKILLDPTEE